MFFVSLIFLPRSLLEDAAAAFLLFPCRKPPMLKQCRATPSTGTVSATFFWRGAMNGEEDLEM